MENREPDIKGVYHEIAVTMYRLTNFLFPDDLPHELRTKEEAQGVIEETRNPESAGYIRLLLKDLEKSLAAAGVCEGDRDMDFEQDIRAWAALGRYLKCENRGKVE